jgi:hypothetical protein
METIQEAFVMLDLPVKELKKFQKYALILHAIALN